MSDFSNLANDYVDELQVEAKLRWGKTLSPSEVAAEFQKHGFEARIQHLKTLKTADSFETPREAAARYVYERALNETHRRLSKINR